MRKDEDLSPPERSDERWIDEGPSKSRGRKAAPLKRSKSSAKIQRGGHKAVRAMDTVVEEFERAMGARASGRFLRRYETALAAFEGQRYGEARVILTPLAKECSDVAAVHDLLGLCLYREGQWTKAIKELEIAQRGNPTSVFNHAVLADCYRALGDHARVALLWLELCEASPVAELMAEGRIVYAGSLIDQGNLKDALSLMEKQESIPKKIHEYHLRQWYVLADIYDRSGDIISARRLFERIISIEADFADVAERLSVLGA